MRSGHPRPRRLPWQRSRAPATKPSTGNEAEHRQRYRDGQKDQLGALRLVVTTLALWSTRYVDATVDQLHPECYPVNDANVAQLSPLIRDHINLLGHYHFSTSDP